LGHLLYFLKKCYAHFKKKATGASFAIFKIFWFAELFIIITITFFLLSSFLLIGLFVVFFLH